MTDEQKMTGSSAGDDGLVSETYRETATERAPEHLNTAVLRTAAKAARPRYSLLRTWTRPVAWAAVVMLSVGLVLELTQTPVTQPPDDIEEAALDDTELGVTDTDMLQRAEEMAQDIAPTASTIPFSEKSALQSSATLMEAEAEPGCDEAARDEPQLWLECIAELEAAGLADLASSEREQLAEVFPDFKQD